MSGIDEMLILKLMISGTDRIDIPSYGIVDLLRVWKIAIVYNQLLEFGVEGFRQNLNRKDGVSTPRTHNLYQVYIPLVL